MIYNIYYNDKNLLNKKIQKITTLKPQNIYFQENDFKNIINLLKQINLFESEKRVFIIHDATFLTNIKIFKKINELINIILSVSDNNFIFLLNNKKKSIANKEINDFLSKTKEIIIPNLTNRTKTQYMLKHELFKEKNFSEEEINNISDNLPLDSMIIDHELNKLSTLMISSNSDDELDVLSIYQEANLFEFTKNFLLKNTNKLFILYKKLTEQKIDEIQLIAIVSNELINILLFKKIYESNKNIKEIASILEMNEFVLRSYANTYSFVCVKYLTIIINQLYLLDKEMKSFSDNKKIIFSFFLLKYL
jgi:DNA polymerase III delta subunit